MADTAYALLVRDIWQTIERRTGRPPVYGDATHIGTDCPVGCGGVLVIQFLDNPPRLKIEPCSHGCAETRIFEALS